MPENEPVRGIAEAHRRIDAVVERVIRVETQQQEVMRRLEKLEGMPDTLAEIKEALAGVREKVNGMSGKVAWIWGLLGVILTGLLGLAWEFIKRGGPT